MVEVGEEELGLEVGELLEVGWKSPARGIFLREASSERLEGDPAMAAFRRAIVLCP